MISEFKFFSELNFFFKNNESFVVYKKPSYNKIVCHQGDVISGRIDDIDNNKGFLFMPFDLNKDGYFLKPKITTETKFHLKVNNKSTNEISIKEFSSKKSSYIKFVN